MADSRANIVLSATDKTRAAFESAKRNAEELRGTAVSLGSAFGAAFTGAGLAGLVVRSAQAIDALNDAADATGASIEKLSALDDLARRTGTSLDSVTGVMVRFNGVLSDATPGSDAAKALEDIGLKADELKQLDPAEALRLVAVALSEFADDGEKARWVQERFGRSIREVAPFLKDLAENGKLNARVTTEQAQEAERFNRQLASVRTNVENLAQGLAVDLLPTITSIVEGFTDATKEGDSLSRMARALSIPFETLAVLGANVAFVFRGVGTEIGGIAAQLAAMGRGDFKGAWAIHESMVEDAVRARKQLDAFEEKILGRRAREAARRNAGTDPAEFAAMDAAGRRSVRNSSGGKGGDAGRTGGKAAGLKLEIEPNLIDPAVQRLLDGTAAAQLEAIEDQLSKLDELSGLGVDATKIQQATARLMTERRELLGEVGPTLPPGEVERREELNRLLADTPTAKMAETNRLTVLLADALERGEINAGQFDEAMQGLVDKAKQGLDSIDEVSQQAGRNIQDALGTTLKRSLKGDFDSIGELWGDLMLDMAAQASAARLNLLLFGEDFAKNGKLGGVVGDILDGVLGGGGGGSEDLLSKLFGGGRANGGPTRAGMLYEINETGVPEVGTFNGRDYLLAGSAGHVTPLQPLGAQAQYVDNRVTNYHVQSGVSRNELMAALQQVVAMQDAKWERRLRQL